MIMMPIVSCGKGHMVRWSVAHAGVEAAPGKVDSRGRMQAVFCGP